MTDDLPWGTNQSWGVPANVTYSSTIRTRLSEASEEPQRGSKGKEGEEGDSGDLVFTGIKARVLE